MKIKINILFIILIFYCFSGYFFEIIESANLKSYGLLISDTTLILLGIFSFQPLRNNIPSNILMAFLVISSLTYLANAHEINFLTHLNGLREFLIVICTFLFFYDIIKSKYLWYFHAKFVIFCWLYLIFQLPTALHQFFQHGAGDAVGGGFGGGGSGLLSLSIFSIIFFLVVNSNLKNNFNSLKIKDLFIYIPFLIPTFINETKLTFILIILFFILLVQFKTVNIYKPVFIISVAITMFIVMDIFYSQTTNKNLRTSNNNTSYEDIFSADFLLRYLTSEEVYAGKDISRITKIRLGYLLLREKFDYVLFGRGLGLFKGGSVTEQSKFSQKYDWLLSGTRPYLFFLLIQTGLCGASLVIFMLFYPLFPKDIQSAPFLLRRLRIFLFILLSIILIYNPAFRTGGFVLIITYIMLFVYHFKGFHLLFRGDMANGK